MEVSADQKKKKKATEHMNEWKTEWTSVVKKIQVSQIPNLNDS